jgi:nitrogen fixation protein NifB
VLVAKVGRCPREALDAAGIEAVDAHAHELIEPAALAWLEAYAERVERGERARAVRREPQPIGGDGERAVA